MRLYYWNSSGYNFGDALGPFIVNAIAQKKVEAVDGVDVGSKRIFEKNLIALGSIFHMVRDGDVVWGTGVNPIRQNPDFRLTEVDIRAVRGPLTRNYLHKKYGLNCPNIYGDPALLLPMIFPESKPQPIRKYGIVPHLKDIDIIASAYDNIILPTLHWQAVIHNILGCELIISSSLHGLIVAEAFGIPARWLHNSFLPSSRTESTFKFNDYYASTDRTLNDWSESVEKALCTGGKAPISNFNHKRLLDAFPHDLFHFPKCYYSQFLALVEDSIRFSRVFKSYLKEWKNKRLEKIL